MMFCRAATFLLLLSSSVVAAAEQDAAAAAASPAATTPAAASSNPSTPMSGHPHNAHSSGGTTPHSSSSQASPAASTSSTTSSNQDSLPPIPQIRFTSWDHLTDSQLGHVQRLKYHEKDWNKPGAFIKEKKDYANLTPADRIEVDGLGLSQAQWDCYVNHYRNYDWSQLTSAQQNAYQVLGWTAQAWDGGQQQSTKIEGKYFEDLTSAQRKAATSLCYTDKLWDEVAIPLWSEDDGSGGVWEKDDTSNLYSAKENQVAKDKGDVYSSLYDVTDRIKGVDFEGPASAHNDRNIPVPFFRYDPWDLISDSLKELATRASYDEKTWNDIGSHPIEKVDFEAIQQKHPKIAKALNLMGFTPKQWDCYMSHYASYDWNELKDVGVQQYYVELGYNHRGWDTEARPETDGMYWPDLTPTQQNAAFQLGYFREVWDEVSLQFWPRTTANTASLKDYAKNHPAAVGGGLIATLTVLIGLVFACACCCGGKCCRKQHRNAKFSPYDLEMYSEAYSDNPYTDDDIAAALDNSLEKTNPSTNTPPIV